MRTAILTILLAICISASAQTYTINPAKTVTFTAAYNNITIHDIYQVNTGNSSIILKWERVSVNLPNGWDYSMCDYGTCYVGIPQGPSTMSTVAVGSSGFLGLNIDPANINGSGVVKARVYQDGFQNNADTLTWYVTTPPVGMEEAFTRMGFQIFPVPAKDHLNIEVPYGHAASISLSDICGRAVMSAELSAGNNSMNLSGIEKGIYSLRLQSGDKTLQKRIVKE